MAVKTVTYHLKSHAVEARRHKGPPLVVISEAHGEQTAQDGDYLVGTKKGEICVVPWKEFEATYTPEDSDEAPTQTNVVKPTEKL
jgi:hypothetical protein